MSAFRNEAISEILVIFFFYKIYIKYLWLVLKAMKNTTLNFANIKVYLKTFFQEWSVSCLLPENIVLGEAISGAGK